MSVKHVIKYYNQICEDYHEMLEELREAEKEAQKNMIPPETLENLKSIVKPMKDNYERWSYMVFLLNQPNKKEKLKKYNIQFKDKKEQLEKNNSIDMIHKENEECIEKIKESFNSNLGE